MQKKIHNLMIREALKDLNEGKPYLKVLNKLVKKVEAHTALRIKKKYKLT